MKCACVVLLLCILQFVLSRDAAIGDNKLRGKSTISSDEALSRHPTAPKGRVVLSTPSLTHRSNSPIQSPKSPPATTAQPTTTKNIHLELKASKTLTVSNHQTASAQVGWIIAGVGAGGSVAVGGKVLPVAGGTK
jgi:hypothetical protein